MHQHQWVPGLQRAMKSSILDLSCCGWECHTPVLLFRAGRKMFRVCLAKSSSCFNLFFLYFSTFSSWNRLPIRKKGCLGRPSHSTIMNLFWWVRGLTEYNWSIQPRQKSCSFYHEEKMDLERTSAKSGEGERGCPALLYVFAMHLLSCRICSWPNHLGCYLFWMSRVHSLRYEWDRRQGKYCGS